MEIVELGAAKGTVVKRKAEHPKEIPQRVEAHRIDLVPNPQSAEFKIVAGGTIGKPLENGESGTIIITVKVAVFAVERGTAQDAADQPAALARVNSATLHAACIDSSEEHFGLC